jgi:23S rRNA (cytosine1962-C5)-methyltransferase
VSGSPASPPIDKIFTAEVAENAELKYYYFLISAYSAISAVNMSSVIISNRAKKRLKGKHPWIFSNEIVEKLDVSAGEVVEIRDEEDHRIATGYFNPHTLIAVRVLSYHHEFDLRDRIAKALGFRRLHYQNLVYRWIYGESDGLPGLIVDRYSQTLVVQILTAGMERLRNEIIACLVEFSSPARILFRNDSSYRELEGLPKQIEWVYGDPVNQEIIELDDLKFELNYTEGQKTGFFLDQQTNRQRLSKYAHGERMLDVFSYSGGWSVYGAKAGLREILAVDSSAEALKSAARNAELNNFRLDCVEQDAFQFMREAYSSKERYDVIVLDPPAFCKSKRQLVEAVRGYREINLRAMKLLERDGVLFTCSCSQPVTPEIFIDVLRQAAADSGRTFRMNELLLHPMDHPVLLQFPESLYLKCAVLQVAG